jgi:UDP-N-acetylmuramate dehydrogenase
MAAGDRHALEQVAGDAVQFDVPTARFTSLRVGGPADAFATPPDRRVLAALLTACALRRIPHLLLGNGFNTVVRDGGVAGLVIRLARFRLLEERPGGCLRAEAGVTHASLTRFCRERGLAGIEFGAGIPGTVGGRIAMNAGVPQREVKDVVRELEVMSPTGRRRSHLGRAGLRFEYRGLRGLAPGSLVLSALLAVRRAERADVEREIADQLAKRADSQPIDQPSCGSVFKNPAGDFAGRLIEAAGLKGTRLGGAEISPLHANFIVNRGRATASDVLGLIEIARKEVRRRSGIRLETEVRIVGREAA